MNIAPITADMAAATVQPIAGNASMTRGGAFEQLLDQVNGLSTQLISSEQSVQQLAQGDAENLHQVVLGLEQTRLAFDLMLQVRNKILDAYQEVMRMQV